MSGKGRVPRQLSIGQQFGNLTVKEILPKRKNWNFYKCECICGKFTVARIDTLKENDLNRSCGCLQRLWLSKTRYIHGGCAGKKDSKEYGAWKGMLSRCLNVENDMYANYGGRGIKVCDRWLDNPQGFLNFKEDLGICPHQEYSLDRIDVNGNYEPENCRWATAKEQARNKQNTRWLTYQGATKSLAEWCEILKIDYSRTITRLNSGKSVDDALFTGKFTTGGQKIM